METRRWFNPSQPQTLQIAVFLLYINAFFSVLFGLILWFPIGLVLIACMVGGGFGIANERKWGYGLGLAAAFAPFALRLVANGVGGLLGTDLINLMFEVALVALLLHPMSRDYERIWFK
jgi:hypothetical protein